MQLPRISAIALIIPNDVLKKILLQSSQRKQFQILQTEILEELEKTLSNELEKVSIEQIECVKKLDNDITLLMQNLNQTNSFNYTNQENATLFISNNYLNERLDYLKKILTNILPTNVSLEQYKQSINELIKQEILTNNDIQTANADLNNKKALLKQIYAIYDKIIRLKYILSPSLNPEKIFALGFVNRDLFKQAETLHCIVLHRTQLFKDMILELPSSLRRYFSLTDLDCSDTITILKDSKQSINTDIFIYQRTSDLNNIYFAQEKKMVYISTIVIHSKIIGKCYKMFIKKLVFFFLILFQKNTQIRIFILI